MKLTIFNVVIALVMAWRTKEWGWAVASSAWLCLLAEQYRNTRGSKS